MNIFTCKDRYEDIMTCIYDAWEWGIKNGHENLKLMKEPVEQYSLFDKYIHIEGNSEKSLKVTRSIAEKISEKAYMDIYSALLSKNDMLDDVYRYLQIGFKKGKVITSMLTENVVMNVTKEGRKVSNETHYFREFARFNSIKGNMYICHIEPKNNIVYQVAAHFADRMPSENWIIIDDNRSVAVMHPKNENMYITCLTKAEKERLLESERYQDEYKNLWKTFFEAVSIKQRENYECQRNHFPIWMRKHTVEF